MRIQWLPESQGEWITFMVLIIAILIVARHIVRTAASNKRVDDYNAWRIESSRETAKLMSKLGAERKARKDS